MSSMHFCGGSPLSHTITNWLGCGRGFASRPNAPVAAWKTGDAWIAATAVHRRLTLLTHDRDLKGLPVSGLTVVSFA
jgi:hypothetical protein